MKQCIGMMCLLIGGNALLFSLQETWFSTGFEWGNSIEHADAGTTYIGAPGCNLTGYGLRDSKDIGMFFHYSSLFPQIVSGLGDPQEYNVQVEFIIGAGFRYSFTDTLKLQWGIGID
jgi:hypothetical protein